MVYLFLQIICAVLLTEALTELIIKSEIVRPLRDLIKSKGSWLGELFSCGYCFSVWAALGIVFLTNTRLPLTENYWLDLTLMVFMVHRLSNYLHNFCDKWLDKYYDVRFVSSDKGYIDSGE